MLNTIEFKATIKDGIIKIPEEYQQNLNPENEYQVILRTTINPTIPQTPRPKDIIDELTENPIPVEGIRKLTRDEIYEL